MARTATGADELPAFSVNCATQAIDVICRICAQVSPRRSGSAAFVCAGLVCANPAGASIRAISDAQNNLMPAVPPATLLRTCIAHIVEIELLLQAPQHFIINFIVIAHV